MFQIRVSQIIQYLSKRYGHIEKIIQAIDKYNDDKVKKLIERHIPLPEEFDTYINYLLGLKEAFAERCGDKECFQIKELTIGLRLLIRNGREYN